MREREREGERGGKAGDRKKYIMLKPIVKFKITCKVPAVVVFKFIPIVAHRAC